MLSRLTHAGVAFAITAVVYQMYVLVAVPLLEPNRPARAIDLSELDPVAGKPHPAMHKYRELLAAYFPPDHWTITQPPISFDNGQALILVDEYQPRDDGQVRVQKCALLFFPHERIPGEAPRAMPSFSKLPMGRCSNSMKEY